MQIFDTLVVGCTYASLGYAIEQGNTKIIDAHQVCDTVFSLTLPSFAYVPYQPRTEEGVALLHHFERLSLIENGMQNTSAFECALCAYLMEKGLIPTLKCRVIETKMTENDITRVTVQTNAGLDVLYTKRIIEASGIKAQRWISILYITEEPERAHEAFTRIFPGATTEPAFYEKRYAAHIPIAHLDINAAKAFLYDMWNQNKIPAKILYIAPLFYQRESGGILSDYGYENPIRAFESGILLAREEKR